MPFFLLFSLMLTKACIFIHGTSGWYQVLFKLPCWDLNKLEQKTEFSLSNKQQWYKQFLFPTEWERERERERAGAPLHSISHLNALLHGQEGRTKAKKMRKKKRKTGTEEGGRKREIDNRREYEPDTNSGEEGRWGVEMKWGGGKSWFLGLCLPGSWDEEERNRQGGVWSRDGLFFVDLAYLMTERRDSVGDGGV